MSDVLDMESLEYKSEVNEGGCKANSTSATAGDSFRSIDCDEVDFTHSTHFELTDYQKTMMSL